MQHYKDIITGKKKMLSNKDLNKIQVWHYKELSAQVALNLCTQDAECWQYIPDRWLKPKPRLSRDYLWAVLATIQTDFTQKILYHAHRARGV